MKLAFAKRQFPFFPARLLLSTQDMLHFIKLRQVLQNPSTHMETPMLQATLKPTWHTIGFAWTR
jgi:hypothetical protein